MTDKEIADIMTRAQRQGDVDVHGRTVSFTPNRRGGTWYIFGLSDTHRTGSFKTALRLLKSELANIKTPHNRNNKEGAND